MFLPLRSFNEETVLHDDFWDCECSDERGYIHPKSCSHCPDCNSFKDDQPDSRVNELVFLSLHRYPYSREPVKRESFQSGSFAIVEMFGEVFTL